MQTPERLRGEVALALRDTKNAVTPRPRRGVLLSARAPPPVRLPPCLRVEDATSSLEWSFRSPPTSQVADTVRLATPMP